MDAKQRLYQRFPVHLKATLIRGKDAIAGHVVDVSFTGLFFTTSRPPPLRDLVKIDLELPNAGMIRVLGMAVHIVRPGPGRKRRAGVGIQLFGIGPDVRAQWDRFVGEVRAKFIEAQDGSGDVDAARSSPADRADDSESVAPVAPVEPLISPRPTADTPRLSTDIGSATIQASIEAALMQADDDAPTAPGVAAGQASAVPTTGQAGPIASSAAPKSPGGPVASKPGGRHEPLGPRLTSEDVIEAVDRLRAEPDEERGAEPEFEVAKPELRVHVNSEADLQPLRDRQQRGEQLFFRTEVHMPAGTDLQVRVIMGDGTTAFIAEGRVVESRRNTDKPGLSILLEPDDSPPSEDIYITIDLETDWLQS